MEAISASSRARSKGASSTTKTFMQGSVCRLDQAVLHGVAHEVGGAFQTELLENARLVRAHRLHGKMQALADLRGAESFDQQAQHLELAVGERFVRRLVASMKEARRRGIADVHAPGRDLAQRAEQRLGGAVLVKVALRARFQRAGGVLA